jgi:uncharacterized membrane protein
MARMGTVETGTLDQGDRGEWQDAGTARRQPSRRSPVAVRTEDAPLVGKGPNEQLANFLGWFSVGLGVSQIVMPRMVSRICGVEDSDGNTGVMRALGVRELTSGVGILTQRKPTNWLWSRVAGDVMDLALLGKVVSNGDNKRGRATFATAAVLGVMALDVLSAQQLAHSPNTAVEPDNEEGIRVRKSITVNKAPEEAYAFWHDFENLPRFMRHLESVRVTSPGRSHWKAKGPAGKSVEWDAVTTRDVPNEVIAWRSEGDADVYNEGQVRFRPAPGGRGTEIHVELMYDPPAGVVGTVGAKIAKLFRKEPGQDVKDDLLAFKQVLEVGEIVLSDATVRRGMPHPAQPDSLAKERNR